jgi:hypothetical protein
MKAFLSCIAPNRRGYGAKKKTKPSCGGQVWVQKTVLQQIIITQDEFIKKVI